MDLVETRFWADFSLEPGLQPGLVLAFFFRF